MACASFTTDDLKFRKTERKNMCRQKRAGPLRGLGGYDTIVDFARQAQYIIVVLTSSPITANNLPFTAECMAIFSSSIYTYYFKFIVLIETTAIN